MIRSLLLFALFALPAAQEAEAVCYVLYDAAGKKLYQDEVPPPAEVGASRARGEHLVTFSHWECETVANPKWTPESGSEDKAASANRLAEAVGRWRKGQGGPAYRVAEPDGANRERPRLARTDTGVESNGGAPLSMSEPIISILPQISGGRRHPFTFGRREEGTGLTPGPAGRGENAVLRGQPAAVSAEDRQAADLLRRMAKGDLEAIRTWLARQSPTPDRPEAAGIASVPHAVQARAPAAPSEPPRIDFETAEKLAVEEEKERSRWWIFQFSPDRRRITRRTLEILGQGAAAPPVYKTREEVFEAYRAGRISREETLRYFQAMAGG